MINARELQYEAQALQDLAKRQADRKTYREAIKLMSLARDLGIKQRAAKRQNKAFRLCKSWEGM